MARRFLVSDGSNVRPVQGYKIAVGGAVMGIARAFVADNGVSRQYYPYFAGEDDKRITWDTVSFIVNQTVSDPADAVASVIFRRSTGLYTYKNYPSADGSGSFMSPALDGTAADDGKYLIRADYMSGDALTGVMGTWLDLNADHQWSLDQTTVGSSTSVAYISISKDDGTGSPVTTTTISKTITFNASVIDTQGSDLTWSSVQRDLVEIKEGVDADCELLFQPTGAATGSADTSGAFSENWAIGGFDPAEYTVTVSVVSGTPPTGAPIGVALSLNIVRQWTLTAGIVTVVNHGEDLSNVLDVTVTDTVNSQSSTKRITMHSQRTEPSIPPVWNPDQWSLSDIGHAQPVSHNVNAHVIFQLDGTTIGRIDNDNIDEVQETDPWLPPGDDPSNYEVRVHQPASGNLPTPDHEDNVWYPMTSEQHYQFAHITLPNIRNFIYELSVRKIGSVTVTKELVVTVTGAIDDGAPPN